MTSSPMTEACYTIPCQWGIRPPAWHISSKFHRSDLLTANLEFDTADFKHGLYLDSWGEIMFFRFRQKIKNELWLVIRYLISHVSSVILSGHFSMLKENYRERSETQVTQGPGNNFPASDNYY